MRWKLTKQDTRPTVVKENEDKRVTALVIDPEKSSDIKTTYVPAGPIPAQALSTLDAEPFVLISTGGKEYDWPQSLGYIQEGDEKGDESWKPLPLTATFVPRPHVYGISGNSYGSTELAPFEYLRQVSTLRHSSADLTSMTPREFAADLEHGIDKYAEALAAEDALDRMDRSRFLVIGVCVAILLAIIVAVVVYNGESAAPVATETTTETTSTLQESVQ